MSSKVVFIVLLLISKFKLRALTSYIIVTDKTMIGDVV
ncbi:hypothetical protein HKX40_04645 [Pelistega europaea]|uniref:Uncharacterized protein n=1 Tax=Pelistega europaea TaxID=106147 RepID=A0A7Y4P659_9BURK|nr:hypothetical protein [Pelistega europaea]